MQTQIPIYRAKKIDSDEYVEGYYIRENTGHFVQGCNEFSGVFKIIDHSTLAIHLPDMIDSEGTKIFASLSEDGKGGDLINADYITGKYNYVLFLKDARLYMRVKDFISDFNYNFFSFKVRGVKKC